MAKVTFPLMSFEVRGKLGDIVFQKRYGKTIARMRTFPYNPRSEAQQFIRENISALAQAWSGSGYLVQTGQGGQRYVILKKKTEDGYEEINFNVLTQAEKTAWQNRAMQTKGAKSLGMPLFIGLNVKRLNQGLDPQRTP